MTDLVIRGGALPTFLLEKIAAATCAARVEPRPPQTVVFLQARHSAEFEALRPLIAAERLEWQFTEE